MSPDGTVEYPLSIGRPATVTTLDVFYKHAFRTACAAVMPAGGLPPPFPHQPLRQAWRPATATQRGLASSRIRRRDGCWSSSNTSRADLAGASQRVRRPRGRQPQGLHGNEVASPWIVLREGTAGHCRPEPLRVRRETLSQDWLTRRWIDQDDKPRRCSCTGRTRHTRIKRHGPAVPVERG